MRQGILKFLDLKEKLLQIVSLKQNYVEIESNIGVRGGQGGAAAPQFSQKY